MKQHRKTILVTGGCGFAGSNLAASAMARGYRTVVIDNLSRHGSASNLEWLRTIGDFRFDNIDVRGPQVDGVIAEESPDVIFHLAGQVAMTTSIENPRLDYEVNAGGTLNVLEAIRNHAPNCMLIYSSSNKVYGDLTQYEYRETATRYVCPQHADGFDETVPFNPHSPYGCSKGAADQYVLDYARTYGLRTVVFRHSTMYGGRQFATYDQGWIGWFCQQALATKAGRLKEPFTISGNGKQVRDILCIDDVVALYFAAADHIETVKGEAFNIGGGMANSLSLLELFALLKELLDVKLSYVSLDWRLSDQRVFVANVGKAKRLLSWEPKISARDGVRQMLKWLDKTA